MNKEGEERTVPREEFPVWKQLHSSPPPSQAQIAQNPDLIISLEGVMVLDGRSLCGNKHLQTCGQFLFLQMHPTLLWLKVIRLMVGTHLLM